MIKYLTLILIVSITLSTNWLAASNEKHGSKAHWGYEGQEGPNNWGDLSPNYNTCKVGRSQSPINITKTIKQDLGYIEFHYSKTPLKIVNNGHTIQVNYSSPSYIITGGKIQALAISFPQPK